MKSLIFVYLLTYGGAAAALLNPLVGLYIYILFAILKPESLWYFSVPAGGHYSRIVAIAMLVGWAWQGFGNWNLRGCRRTTAPADPNTANTSDLSAQRAQLARPTPPRVDWRLLRCRVLQPQEVRANFLMGY